MLIPLGTDIVSTSYNHITMANSSSFACNDEDHVVLLQNVELKLQCVNENFECFKEDFENLAFIGNNIKMRLKSCCVDTIISFDRLLDKFVDVLTTFNRGLKGNLDTWLKVESTLAGKQCFI